jgi:hypothetical protein
LFRHCIALHISLDDLVLRSSLKLVNRRDEGAPSAPATSQPQGKIAMTTNASARSAELEDVAPAVRKIKGST